MNFYKSMLNIELSKAVDISSSMCSPNSGDIVK